MYLKATELDPRDALAHHNLGNLYRQREQWSSAEEMYLKAMQLDPREGVCEHLVLVYEAQGKVDAAEKLYRHNVKQAPNDPAACNGLAWFFAERGIKLDEALSLGRRAVQLAPDNPDILDTLGWVYYKRAEFAEAETWLKKAIEQYGQSPIAGESWVHLGMVYEKKGDRGAAMNAYDQALSLQPDHKGAMEALERLHGMNERGDE